MELYIHTLTGTIFELRVSPFETIQSIKSKVQRLEGIAMSQQHLIWRSKELEDGYCLHDYGIKSGATLTLVLAMRGGPINMRRVSLEEPSLQDMAEYMDENRDELWDKIMNDNKHVTLLVYREGDQLNFFRVYDGSPATMSPYSDTISGTSRHGQDDETSPGIKSDVEHNLITKDKMRLLRQKITVKNSKKLPSLQPRPPTSGLASASLAKRRLQLARQHSKRDHLSPCCLTQNSNPNHSPQLEKPIVPSPIKLLTMTKEIETKDLTKQPPLPNISRTEDPPDFVSPNGEVSDISLPSNLSNHSPATVASPPMKNSARLLPELQSNSTTNDYMVKTVVDNGSAHKSSRSKARSLKPLGAVDKNMSTKLLQQMMHKCPPAAPPSTDMASEKNVKNSPRNRRCSKGTANRKLSKTGAPLPNLESGEVSLPRLPPSSRDGAEDGLDETLKLSQLPDVIRDPVEYENYKNLLKWVYPGGKDEVANGSGKHPKQKEGTNTNSCRPLSKTRRKIDGRPSSRVRSSKLLPHLPPVHYHSNSSNNIKNNNNNNNNNSGNANSERSVPTLTGKKKPRCSMCSKKLGLATTYPCRCGIKFCAKHRYPEAHSCTFDYKAEGRRLLERSNPVVTAPKLPKI